MKMTSQVVKTSGATADNSVRQDYTNLDDLTVRSAITLGRKPSTDISTYSIDHLCVILKLSLKKVVLQICLLRT